MTQSYSGTVSDGQKSYNISLVLSEIAPPVVEPPVAQEAEPGTQEAQEMPDSGVTN